MFSFSLAKKNKDTDKTIKLKTKNSFYTFHIYYLLLLTFTYYENEVSWDKIDNHQRKQLKWFSAT